MEKTPVTVFFGGRAYENWTDAGLTVSYAGRTGVLAVRSPRGWLAAPCPPGRGGDVKTDMAEYARSRELAFRINDGSAPPLTAAYFRAAAAARADSEHAADARLSPGEPAPPFVMDGGADSLELAETLRILLDDKRMSWDGACAAIAERYVCAPQKRHTAPLSAVAALQPRTVSLINAVNEKLCALLWDKYPGDWERIASGAAVSCGEVDFVRLSAAMCGEIHCTKEQRAGEMRTLYTVMPAKFKEI